MFKKFVKEFKEFAVKGNMIDMAVGIIIGAAFSGVVNSLLLVNIMIIFLRKKLELFFLDLGL